MHMQDCTCYQRSQSHRASTGFARPGSLQPSAGTFGMSADNQYKCVPSASSFHIGCLARRLHHNKPATCRRFRAIPEVCVCKPLDAIVMTNVPGRVIPSYRREGIGICSAGFMILTMSNVNGNAGMPDLSPSSSIADNSARSCGPDPSARLTWRAVAERLKHSLTSLECLTEDQYLTEAQSFQGMKAKSK